MGDADDLEPGSTVDTVRDDPAVVRGEVWVRDFALVTYRVPAARVQAVMPDRFEPQAFRDERGEWALVSATCFLNDQLGWAAGPSPRLTAYQATFRAYVRHGDRVGSFFFSSYLGTTPTTLGQKLGLADSRRAQFQVDIDRRDDGGYERYRAVMEADDGRSVLDVRAVDPPAALPPFRSGDEHVRFITHRLHGFSRSLAGPFVDAQVEHPVMSAFGGTLLQGRFPALDRLGLVPFHEQDVAYSVLVSPGTRFELLPPVPAT